MVTVPQIVEKIVQNSPLVEEGLSLGFINLSAYARSILPKVQTATFKDVTEGSVVIALRRLNTKTSKDKHQLSSIIQQIEDISVKSNITEYVVANEDLSNDKLKKILNVLQIDGNIFFVSTRGLKQATLIVSSKMENTVDELLDTNHAITKIAKLSALSLTLPSENIDTPGIYYAVLKALAWEGINIVEVVSTADELTLLFKERDIQKAFNVIQNLIHG